MKQSWDLKIYTVSELNVKEHWAAASKRHKWQHFLIRGWWREFKPEYQLPLSITLIRLSPRKLDYDNLVAAFKWVKDSIADQIFPGQAAGRADDSTEIEWQYGQETSKSYGIRIEFTW